MKAWDSKSKTIVCKGCKHEFTCTRARLYCSEMCMMKYGKKRPGNRTFSAREWHIKRYASRVAAGLCPMCDQPIDASGKSRCSSCCLKQANKRLARIESGTCIQCKSPAEATIYCLHHWFTRIGHAWGLTVHNGGVDALKRLWAKQDGRCALTGEVLIPGKTASIDHDVPRARGGLSVESNLQWVTKAVNKSKMDMTSEEFRIMCNKVIQNQSSVSREAN